MLEMPQPAAFGERKAKPHSFVKAWLTAPINLCTVLPFRLHVPERLDHSPQDPTSLNTTGLSDKLFVLDNR